MNCLLFEIKCVVTVNIQGPKLRLHSCTTSNLTTVEAISPIGQFDIHGLKRIKIPQTYFLGMGQLCRTDYQLSSDFVFWLFPWFSLYCTPSRVIARQTELFYRFSPLNC